MTVLNKIPLHDYYINMYDDKESWGLLFYSRKNKYFFKISKIFYGWNENCIFLPRFWEDDRWKEQVREYGWVGRLVGVVMRIPGFGSTFASLELAFAVKGAFLSLSCFPVFSPSNPQPLVHPQPNPTKSKPTPHSHTGRPRCFLFSSSTISQSHTTTKTTIQSYLQKPGKATDLLLSNRQIHLVLRTLCDAK